MKVSSVSLSLALSLGSVACGSSAIVRTNDGRLVEGEIGGHDSSTLSIGGQRLSRSDVADIDHPGNVAGILGTIIASVGALTALGNCTEEARAQDDTPCASSGIWILTGLPIAIYGWVTHSASVDRAGQ
jgi:hypothetical protein